jgi:hypothetical protein
VVIKDVEIVKERRKEEGGGRKSSGNLKIPKFPTIFKKFKFFLQAKRE